MNQLCSQDKAILNSMFNPLLPLGEGVVDDDPEGVAVLAGEGDEGVGEEARALNGAGVKAGEKGDKGAALEAFGAAIAQEPKWAAPYNNRAQVYRLMRRDTDAIADLERAMELSDGRGSAACQAALQRAMLYRLHGDDDSARRLFQQAADLGSAFAKSQMVSLNPHAALCNKMLAQMMTEVKSGAQ